MKRADKLKVNDECFMCHAPFSDLNDKVFKRMVIGEVAYKSGIEVIGKLCWSCQCDLETFIKQRQEYFRFIGEGV